MPAYVIGHIRILDAAKWQTYRERVPATLAPWGGEVVFRGRLDQVLAGEHPFEETVVIRFPDRESANGWHESEAYQSLIPLRQQAAEVLLLSYEA